MSQIWPSWYKPLPTASVSDIIALAAQLSGLRPQDIRDHGRTAIFIRVRHAVCLIARENGHGYKHIARCLGNRDHSTIINGKDKAGVWTGHDPVYARFVAELRRAATVRRPVMTIEGKATFARTSVALVRPVASVSHASSATPPGNDMDLLSSRVAAHYAEARA